VRRRAAAGQGGQRQAAGLTEIAVRAMLATLGARRIDCRDRALLLVARDLLARRGELVALRVRDLMPAQDPRDGGATIRIARAKTDAPGRGRALYLGPRTYAAVRTWLRVARVADGPLFRSVHVTGKVGARLHAASVSPILKKLARRAAPTLRRHGIDPEGVSGHSCRVGMAQDLVAAGFDVVAIMPAGRWASPEMVARYTERLHAGRGAVARYYRVLAARRRVPTAGP
jgi:integrase